MTDTVSTATLVERINTMDAEELGRLQVAIDRRRGELDGEEVAPTAGFSSTVIERRSSFASTLVASQIATSAFAGGRPRVILAA